MMKNSIRPTRLHVAWITLLALVLVATSGLAQFGNDYWRQQQEQQRRLDEQRRQEAEFWRRQREDQQRREEQQRFMDNQRRQQEELQRTWQRQQEDFRRRQDEDSRRLQKQFEDQWRQQQSWNEAQRRLQESWRRPVQVPGHPEPSKTKPDAVAEFKGATLRQAEKAVKEEVQQRLAAAKAGLSGRVDKAANALAHGSIMAKVLEQRRAADRVAQALAQRPAVPATSTAGDRMRQALTSPTAAGQRLQHALEQERK
jgi:hypothetical protein